MIDKVEKIIRKRWLCLYIINMSLGVIYFIYRILFKKEFTVEPFNMGDHYIMLWVSLSFSTSIIVGLTWSFFYFPYIKKGTKLLTIQLILAPIFILLSMCKITAWESYQWILTLVGILQSAVFFYFSLDLLRINRLHNLSNKGRDEEAEKIAKGLKKRFRIA